MLALLFIADACMPRAPVGDRANSNPITIRIHSDLKWPERVVYDTSLPTIVPPRTASAAVGCEKAGGEAATPTQTGKEARGAT